MKKQPKRRPTTKPSAKRKKKVRRPPAQLEPAHERERLKPISLHPLTFEQAIDTILKAGKKPRE
jgi:hypothetical protein